MSEWIHLSLWFKKDDKIAAELAADARREKPIGIYRELLSYLNKVVDSLSPDLLKRYFFFFEPQPHLFLALEINDRKNIDLVKERINQIQRPAFVDTARIDLDTGDGNNGEAALDFFHAGSKYAFFRIGDDYKPGYLNNDEIKLIHCFSNQLFVDRKNERIFYSRCLNPKGIQTQNL